MTSIQLLAILLGTVFLGKALYAYKEDEVSWRFLTFWGGLWCALLLLAIFPRVTTQFFTWIGVERPLDLALYMSIILLFYLVFRLFVKLHELEEDITELVREIAKK